jgi:hypothetical protein
MAVELPLFILQHNDMHKVKLTHIEHQCITNCSEYLTQQFCQMTFDYKNLKILVVYKVDNFLLALIRQEYKQSTDTHGDLR